MADNGTIARIHDHLFRVRVPLPGTPLGNLNAYVIKSATRNLIIDTGFNQSACKSVLFSALETLDVDLEQTDIFLTHFHADHVGLVQDLLTDNSSVYCHRWGYEKLKNWDGFEQWINLAKIHGFPHELLRKSFAEHPFNDFKLKWMVRPTMMGEGDVITIGDYRLCCKETPGHSQDHLCLYEPRYKILFSGDHILGDISPYIQWPGDASNPLKDFMESLMKIDALDISIVLPAHRESINNHRLRIKELIDHHHRRINEIMSKLSEIPKTAFTLASEMIWGNRESEWDKLPIQQQWFATSEMLAHLRFLDAEGRIGKQQVNNLIYFKVESV